jgi:hypothetical protein
MNARNESATSISGSAVCSSRLELDVGESYICMATMRRLELSHRYLWTFQDVILEEDLHFARNFLGSHRPQATPERPYGTCIELSGSIREILTPEKSVLNETVGYVKEKPSSISDGNTSRGSQNWG